MGEVDEDFIRNYIHSTLAGVEVQIASKEGGAHEIAWGDTFFIYDPEGNAEEARRFPSRRSSTRTYGEFDNFSNLDRPGVYRLNIGVRKETYAAMFGEGGEHDYTALDRLLPHPVYGQYHFICVLNPSKATFETVKPLLAEAYEVAVRRYHRKRD